MEHGGDLTAAIEKFGGAFDDWLDLSTGINPYPYAIPSSLADQSWTKLPSQKAHEKLLSAARRAYNIPDHLGVVAAPGTQILISLLPMLLRTGIVAITSPTYSSHKKAWEREGHETIEVSSIHALPSDANIALLVNPNNPDGQLVDARSLKEISAKLTSRQGYLIVDEAFADVVPGASLLAHIDAENTLVLRSFGKFFGLAGIRIGFLIGPRSFTDQMSSTLESWSVSGPALEIGALALNDLDWQSKMGRRLADEMADLTILLSQSGLSVFGGTPLYALAAIRNAKGLHEALAKRRIWTRIFDYAPTWIRIGLPAGKDENARLHAALAEAIPEL